MCIAKEKNVKLINERLEAGLALLRKYYEVEEQPVDAVLANPVIGGRPHHARRFDIDGVGNLLVMTVTEAEENQLSSFVIMPYFKNLPLFSTDYVYSGEKRFFLLEIYDLSVRHDGIFEAGIESFRAFGAEM
ncbi:MAG: bilin reductase, partial [Mogibacterium sp.]|nr:bilin reductase [Mogibacterium sp.]